MPLAGVTQRSMARIITRYLLSSASLWRFKGRVADLEEWTNLGLYSCRVTATGSVAYGSDRVEQQQDAEVLLAIPGGQGPDQPTFDRNGRYRVKVTEFRSKAEAVDPNGPPEAKRTWYLEAVSMEPIQDNRGTDFMALLRCKNAKPWTD